MSENREITRRAWGAIGVRLALFILAQGAAMILLPGPGTVIVSVVGLYLLVTWHNRSFDYRCQRCENVFSISALTNLISPHGPTLRGTGWKLLKCPGCGQWSRADVVPKQ
jgi:hypothetical protein